VFRAGGTHVRIDGKDVTQQAAGEDLHETAFDIRNSHSFRAILAEFAAQDALLSGEDRNRAGAWLPS
jgi:hypothetical protein